MARTAAAAAPSLKSGFMASLLRKAPPAALALDADPGGDDVDHAIGDRGRAVGHPDLQDAVDVGVVLHARGSSDDRGTGVSVECGTHGAMGVMESGADRPGGDAEKLGDLGRLVAHEVAEHEDRPLVRA